MRNEVSTQADYYKTTSGDFAAHMSVKDNNEPIIELTLTVPTEETCRYAGSADYFITGGSVYCNGAEKQFGLCGN